MAHQGPVKTPVQGQQAYTAGVQGGAKRWADGIQVTQLNPMDLAAAQAQKAITNYSARLTDNGPGGWVQRLRSTPVGYWKSQCGAQAQQKYAMAKGATKWAAWYQRVGQTMATDMRNSANASRGTGQPWQARVVAALTVATTFKGQ